MKVLSIVRMNTLMSLAGSLRSPKILAFTGHTSTQAGFSPLVIR
jgi:hypothetical protein